MDWLSRIFAWLSDHEAGFSAVAAIAVLAGILFTGLRLLVGRRSRPTPEPTTKPTSEEDPLPAPAHGPRRRGVAIRDPEPRPRSGVLQRRAH